MFRQLKFRVWDKFNAKFWYSHEYSSMASFFHAMQRLVDGDNELILEQFTGIKDCNGKDLYEGDIVAMFIRYPDEGFFLSYGSAAGSKIVNFKDLSDDYRIGAIEFADAAFYCVLIHNQQSYRSQVNDTMESIGNIHENPELLDNNK